MNGYWTVTMRNPFARKSLISLVIALLLLPAIPNRSEAQLGEAATVFGGIVVDKILGRMSDRIDRIVARAIEGGDFLVEKTGLEIDLAIENLAHALAEERNATFDRLSTEHQKLLSTIHRLVDELEESPRKILELEDFVALDLKDLADSIVSPWKEREYMCFAPVER